jgi:hypothetical protein
VCGAPGSLVGTDVGGARVDGFVTVVLIGVGCVLVALLACAPMLLSWPAHVRWTTIASSIGQTSWFPTGVTMMEDFRAVVLEALETGPDHLHVRLHETGRPAREILTFERGEVSAELQAMLAEWKALRTPLLLHIDRFRYRHPAHTRHRHHRPARRGSRRARDLT